MFCRYIAQSESVNLLLSSEIEKKMDLMTLTDQLMVRTHNLETLTNPVHYTANHYNNNMLIMWLNLSQWV